MTFDVDEYLDRIGWKAGREETAARPSTLEALMRAHVFAIPFENLDPVSGRVPSLALDDVAAKLVSSGRGGYCFEHATLFAAVLRELGFQVSLHAARVVLGAQEGAVRPRSHGILFVHFANEPVPFVADVGFGAPGALLAPVPLIAGIELYDEPRRHRLVRGGQDTDALPTWTLQALTEGEWVSQYMFTEETFQPVDYEVANWYVATFPRSPFKLAPYIQHTNSERHLELSGRTLTERRVDGTRDVREIEDDDELKRLLRNDFGIDVPPYFG
jgi:N-hydroxyarylamine O-acetyltransferase